MENNSFSDSEAPNSVPDVEATDEALIGEKDHETSDQSESQQADALNDDFLSGISGFNLTSDDDENSTRSVDISRRKARNVESSPQTPKSPPAPDATLRTRVGGMLLNKSFATVDFGGDSVASDEDDGSEKRNQHLVSDAHVSSTASEHKRFSQEVSSQGINIMIELNDDEGSLGDFSELTLGNQSYILDLAMQKEARQKNLKEEVYEEALILYRHAKEKGHGGEDFFLMLVGECQKKIQSTKVDHYKKQDELLNAALNEELERRQIEMNSSAGSLISSTSVGPRESRGHKLDNIIQHEQDRRQSMKTSSQDLIRAGSQILIEMSEGGDYDWEDPESDEEETRGSLEKEYNWETVEDETEPVVESQSLPKKKTKKKRKIKTEKKRCVADSSSEGKIYKLKKKKSKAKLTTELGREKAAVKKVEADDKATTSKKNKKKKEKTLRADRTVGVEAAETKPRSNKKFKIPKDGNHSSEIGKHSQNEAPGTGTSGASESEPLSRSQSLSKKKMKVKKSGDGIAKQKKSKKSTKSSSAASLIEAGEIINSNSNRMLNSLALRGLDPPEMDPLHEEDAKPKEKTRSDPRNVIGCNSPKEPNLSPAKKSVRKIVNVFTALRRKTSVSRKKKESEDPGSGLLPSNSVKVS